MWLHEANVLWCDEGNLIAARTWFDAAVRRVPGYAPALGHLAEVDAALGAHQAAIDRLRPLALSSDDPEYAGNLASVLTHVGETEEAEHWRIKAAARYEQLVHAIPRPSPTTAPTSGSPWVAIRKGAANWPTPISKTGAQPARTPCRMTSAEPSDGHS